jgi:hypothetical protein
MTKPKPHAWAVAQRLTGGRVSPMFTCGDPKDAAEIVRELRGRGQDVAVVEIDDRTAFGSSDALFASR